MILVSWLSINTNSRTWGSDGMAYIPERWLPKPETPNVPADLPRATLGGWQHLASFSEGPRICIGYRLAVLEIKAILLALVRDFKFDPVEQVPKLTPVPAPGERPIPTGEMLDIKIKKTFAGLVQPHIENGEEAGMGGVWLPVKVRLADDME